MKRSIVFWLYFVVAIILAIYLMSRIIMTMLGYGDIARVRRVSISADNTTNELETIQAVATPAPGTHTYTINLKQLNEKIMDIPGVKYSAVRRRANGNLDIRVQMYQAVALWTDDNTRFFPLSADGTIVNRPSMEREPGTVLFRGTVPNNIDEITKSAHNIISDLDYLEWIENRRWNLYTTGGTKIMLPETDPTSAINTISIMNKNNQILSREIDVIDMRDTARILVK